MYNVKYRASLLRAMSNFLGDRWELVPPYHVFAFNAAAEDGEASIDLLQLLEGEPGVSEDSCYSKW